MKHNEFIKQMNEHGTQTASKADNSPRGFSTVAVKDIKPGDKVILNNRFIEIEADEQTEAQPIITNIYKLDNGYILVLYSDGSKKTLLASERPQNIELLKAIENGETEATDEAKKQARENRYTLEREEREAKEENDNRETCKRIAEEVEIVAGGNSYKCPHCGEIFTMDELEDSEHENEDGETVYTCPHCGEEIEESDIEAVSMWEYLDDVLDVDYVCNSRGEFSAVKFAVALGGPSIYFDTDKRAVCLYWWGASAQWGLSPEAVNALDEVGEEMFNCLK